MKKFAEIEIGERAEIKHQITQQDLERFVALTGDDNRLHVDAEFAKSTPFKHPVVHGMLGASFISTLIGTKLPGDGALWFANKLEFLAPVRIGDELTIVAEVIKKNERDHSIELETTIYNQNKQKVTIGSASVRIVEQLLSQQSMQESTVPARKVALVVGGTGGIGTAACLKLAQDGFDLAIHYYKNSEKAENLKAKISQMGRKAMCFQADMSQAERVQAMIDNVLRHFDTISVLVNCAAPKIMTGRFQDLNLQDLTQQFHSNISSCFFLLKAVVPVMEQQNYGKVIHLTTQAIETPNADWLAYITAKSALHGFSKALALDLAPKGIRLNMVSPGMTDTDFISEIPEKIRLVTAAKTPFQRLASPADIANAIGFLASAGSDFLSGETIRVNGGQFML